MNRVHKGVHGPGPKWWSMDLGSMFCIRPMLRCDWLVLAVSVCCTFGGPLSYGSPVVVFLDRGHPCFRNFFSTIPVDFVRMESYVNRL